MEEAKKEWYVVNTYAGHENRVKDNLEKRLETMGISDNLFRIVVAEETQIEVKNEKSKEVVRNIFPGYLFVEMIMTDEAWYVVRNTRGVTGFVGPGSKPVPLTDEEVESMGVMKTAMDIDLEVGETINIISGALSGFAAIIQEINVEKGKIKALVDMFGRETLAELDFNQVEKLD